MATSNVTIDDSSSLFLYEPRDAWTSSSGDDAQAYMNSTFHGTSVSGATCKFKFNGTGIWLYGAKKPDYGSFTLVVDDTVTTYDNATASDPTFGQLLGGVSNLKMGEHVATLMNGGTGPIDFDSLVFETVDPQQPKAVAHATGGQTASEGSGSQASSAASPQSTTSRLSASPNATENTDDGDPNQDGSSPASPTDAPTVAPSDAPPSASPTDGNAQPPAPSASDATPVSGPSDVTSQTPVESNGQTLSGQPAAQPNAVQPTGQAESLNNSTVAGASKPQNGVPKGAIIGIAIGGAILLLVLLALIFILLRRRRRMKAHRRKGGLPSPTLPLQDPNTEFGYFFRGQGMMAEEREQYLGRSQQRMSQISSDSGATLRGYGGPYKEKDVTDMTMPTPLPQAFMRNSSYTSSTGTLRGFDDASDITDMYARMDPGVPVRPPRPPELRLSLV